MCARNVLILDDDELATASSGLHHQQWQEGMLVLFNDRNVIQN
jgi:hypothetical protein